jgi:hypothetical protein
MASTISSPTAEEDLRPTAAAEALRAAASVPTTFAERGTRDLSETFATLASRIGPSTEHARVQIGIRRAGVTRHWSLVVGPEGCAVRPEGMSSPDIDVVVVEEAWWNIAEGYLAPLEAFSRGVLTADGDLNMALNLLDRIQRSA